MRSGVVARKARATITLWSNIALPGRPVDIIKAAALVISRDVLRRSHGVVPSVFLPEGDRPVSDTRCEIASEPIDLSAVSLAVRHMLEGKVLGAALERVSAEACCPVPVVAGFDNKL